MEMSILCEGGPVNRKRVAALGRRACGLIVLAAVAGAFGVLTRPAPLSAGGDCGWECKGKKCKEDAAYPTLTCNEVGEICENRLCDPVVE